ncbi:MAG: hypothetical protein QOG53_3162 [Frankiales bacterium]|jgi:hypothetical protein|nr:hypothetical protein [Frankiales bacterium]
MRARPLRSRLPTVINARATQRVLDPFRVRVERVARIHRRLALNPRRSGFESLVADLYRTSLRRQGPGSRALPLDRLRRIMYAFA